MVIALIVRLALPCGLGGVAVIPVELLAKMAQLRDKIAKITTPTPPPRRANWQKWHRFCAQMPGGGALPCPGHAVGHMAGSCKAVAGLARQGACVACRHVCGAISALSLAWGLFLLFRRATVPIKPKTHSCVLQLPTMSFSLLLWVALFCR